MSKKFPNNLENHPKLRSLFKIAKKLKCSVSFNNYGSWWNGFYDPQDKAIVVNIRQHNGKWFSLADIAFILAHEICHALHDRKGEFRFALGLSLFGPEEDELKDIAVKYFGDIAYDGELECDKYANSYLDRYFVGARSHLRGRVYPRWKLDKRLLNGQDLIIRDRMEQVCRSSL